MDTLGLIIVILAGTLTFVSAVLLAFSKNEDREFSGFSWIDFILLGGIISFFLGLARGVSDAFYDRKSAAFIMTVVFSLSLITLSLGLWMTNAFQ